MLVLLTAFSTISSFLFGYDLGLMGGALLHIQAEFGIGEGVSEVIVGAAKLGAVLGTFLGGALMLYYGRRPAIAADSIFFIVGPAIMAGAWNVAGLIVGRFIVGMGIGISAVVVTAYLGEVAPAKSRGRVVELYEVMLCLGMMTSALINAALNDVTNNWRWMVGVPAIPALLMSLAVCIIPESPRWLVVQGRLDDALAVIHRVHTNKLLPLGAQTSTAEVENELMELWSAVERDKDAASKRAQHLEEGRRQRRSARGGRGSNQAHLEGHQLIHQDKKHTPENSSQDLRELRSRIENEEWSHELTALNAGREDSAAAGAGASTAWPPPRPPSRNGSDAFGSHFSTPERKQSSGEIPDSLVIGIPPRLARIRTRSNDRLYEMEEESVVLNNSTVGNSTNSDVNSQGVGERYESNPAPRNDSLITQNSNDLSPVHLDQDASGSPSGSAPLDHDQHTPPGQLQNGFWATAWHMMKDIWAVARGPESSAFTMILILAFFNQAFASTAIINYAPSVLEQAGVQSTAAASLFTSIVGASKLAGVVIAFFLIDSVGRRPLLLWGSLGSALSLAILIPADWKESHALLVVGMCLFIFSFSISWAGVFWVLLSESFSMGAKSPASSAATAVLFLTGAIADMLFLSFHTWMGPLAFLLYACIALAAAVYVAVAVPETKGRTLQEVQDMLAGRRQTQRWRGGEQGSFVELPQSRAAGGL